MYNNRVEAGILIAEELQKHINEDCIIFGIHPGGSVISKVTAEKLGKQWGVIISEKLSLPYDKRIVIGAVAQGKISVLNHKLIEYYNISTDYLENEIEQKLIGVNSKLLHYRVKDNYNTVKDKTVVIIDENAYVEFVLAAAVGFINKYNPRKIVIAVPTAYTEAINILISYVDEFICLEIPGACKITEQVYEEYLNNIGYGTIYPFKQRSREILV